MKISKELQKKCLNKVKEIGKNYDFRCKSGSLYKVLGDNFVHITYLIVQSKKIVFSIGVKKYSHDNIFWAIMNMEENTKEPDSFRAIGAFVAPSILIETGEYALAEDVDEVAELFVQYCNSKIINFLSENEVNCYILSNKCSGDDSILKCLAYIDTDMRNEAKEMAMKEIANKNTGRFVNEDKGFFEWMLLYLNKEESFIQHTSILQS